MKTASGSNQESPSKEPSLGPVCGFFFLVACVAISMSVIVIAWWMGNNQHLRASTALRTQLIPWIEQSSLSNADRQSITERLNELVEDMDANRLNKNQLIRLQARLGSAPIFQWGVVEAVVRQANASSELSDAEKEAISAASDRLLRTVLDGRIAMEQIEFAAQQVANKERQSGRLTVHDEISSAEFREFLRRITAVSDRAKTPNEPLEKSVAQVFRMMIDSALNENRD